jgi:hypothetical protein
VRRQAPLPSSRPRRSRCRSLTVWARRWGAAREGRDAPDTAVASTGREASRRPDRPGARSKREGHVAISSAIGLTSGSSRVVVIGSLTVGSPLDAREMFPITSPTTLWAIATASLLGSAGIDHGRHHSACVCMIPKIFVNMADGQGRRLLDPDPAARDPRYMLPCHDGRPTLPGRLPLVRPSPGSSPGHGPASIPPRGKRARCRQRPG